MRNFFIALLIRGCWFLRKRVFVWRKKYFYFKLIKKGLRAVWFVLWVRKAAYSFLSKDLCLSSRLLHYNSEIHHHPNTGWYRVRLALFSFVGLCLSILWLQNFLIGGVGLGRMKCLTKNSLDKQVASKGFKVCWENQSSLPCWKLCCISSFFWWLSTLWGENPMRILVDHFGFQIRNQMGLLSQLGTRDCCSWSFFGLMRKHYLRKYYLTLLDVQQTLFLLLIEFSLSCLRLIDLNYSKAVFGKAGFLKWGLLMFSRLTVHLLS